MSDHRYRLFCGDNLYVLGKWRDRPFVDAIITDPPAGINFMGKKWDHDKNNPEKWIAWLAERLEVAFSVLKPGGHGLVWALPRTSHRTGWAIEKAGFEIRDRVSHFFGTGFAKGGSSDAIALRIDKFLGNEPVVVGENPNHRPGSGTEYEGIYNGGNTGAKFIKKPVSEEALEWEGWATTLKPACEDWWLIRKPFKGPVYKNVMKHGTGAINVDACRIPTAEKLTRKLGKTTESDSGWKSTNRSEIAGKDGGRWPANITFDEEAAAMLDEQGGYTRSGAMKRVVEPYEGESVTNFLRGHSGPHNQYGDEGGVSRFFYCAKAPDKEKNFGLDEDEKNDHPTVKSIALMRWLVRLITPPNGIVLDPFMGSGSTGVACMEEGFRFLGIDQDEHYVELARKRIDAALQEVR